MPFTDSFFKKNITPNELAYGTAAIVTLILLVIYIILNFLTSQNVSIAMIVSLILTTFMTTYLSFYYVLEWFLYRKIKLVYKQIRTKKVAITSKRSSINMRSDVLSDIESEVAQWEADSKKEIEQLKQQEEYRREFLGNVSHELKTPIFNIQGYIDTLIDGGLSDDNINISYLVKASKNVDRLEAIVKDLEMITRHEVGQLKMNYETFDIHTLVLEVFEAMEMLADANDINLRFKDDCDEKIDVYADREKIGQVLNNLIANSIKYGKDEGTTWLGLYDMGKNILIEVTDNGIGIDAQHLPRLFERFYRIDSSRSRQKGGSGLGLAIAKHIVEAHEQSIHVRSELNLGTTFGFALKKT